MATREVISNEEMDALLEGVSDGQVPTNVGVSATGEVQDFELRAGTTLTRHCPVALTTIYSRFSLKLSAGLHELLRRDVDVELESIRAHRYDEYMAGLSNPSCLHSFCAEPVRGTGLFVLDGPLVYGFVDHYFGGEGQTPGDTNRPLTPAELRMAEVFVRIACQSLQETWSRVTELTFTDQGCETDPRLVTISAPTELMLVALFRINLAGTPGELHIALPESMLKPVRALLEASGQGDVGERERFVRAVRSDIRDAELELHSRLCKLQMSLRDLLALSPGDVIPVDLPETILLQADETPVMKGTYGVSRGMNAVKITGRHLPPASPS